MDLCLHLPPPLLPPPEGAPPRAPAVAAVTRSFLPPHRLCPRLRLRPSKQAGAMARQDMLTASATRPFALLPAAAAPSTSVPAAPCGRPTHRSRRPRPCRPSWPQPEPDLSPCLPPRRLRPRSYLWPFRRPQRSSRPRSRPFEPCCLHAFRGANSARAFSRLADHDGRGRNRALLLEIPAAPAPPALGAATAGPFSELPANDSCCFIIIIRSRTVLTYVSTYLPSSDMHIHMLGGRGVQ